MKTIVITLITIVTANLAGAANIERNGNVFEISGSIGAGDIDKLNKAFNQDILSVGDQMTVDLKTSTGSSDTGVQLFKFLRGLSDQGVIVETRFNQSGVCDLSCLLVFAAGDFREAHPQSRFANYSLDGQLRPQDLQLISSASKGFSQLTAFNQQRKSSIWTSQVRKTAPDFLTYTTQQ